MPPPPTLFIDTAFEFYKPLQSNDLLTVNNFCGQKINEIFLSHIQFDPKLDSLTLAMVYII